MTAHGARWMTGERADDSREWLLSAIARGEYWRDERSPWGVPDGNALTIGLAARPESVKEARDFARSTLGGWGLDAMYDDVRLVVSELITNALRHATHADAIPAAFAQALADVPIRFSMVRSGVQVIVAVTDPSDEAPAARDADFAAQSGRGLHLVEAFCQAWNWTPLRGPGKVVWAAFASA